MDPIRISFRPRTSDDEADMRRLFEESRDYLLPHVPVAMRPALADMQYRAFQASLVDAEGLRDEVVVVDGALVGRAITREQGECFTGIELAIASAVRGLGIGSHVLQRFLARADAASARIELRVRLGNPAEELYARHGFMRVIETDVDFIMQRVPVRASSIG
jgi:GNAT superfamily N-acetyltransferase